MVVWLALTCVFCLAASIGIPFFLMRRYSSELQRVISEQVDGWNAELEKVKPTISKAYGLLTSESITPKKVKTAEKYISEDIMNKYPEAKAILGTISPRTAEYLEENPDILIEVINRWGPKIEAILGNVDLGALTKTSKPSRGKTWAWER